MNTRTCRPAILSEAGAHADWIARPFLDAGYTLDTCTLADVPAKLATGLYNVVVLGRWYTQRMTKQEEERLADAVIDAVRTHLAAGGGVFFTLPSGGVLAFDNLIGPYGASIPKLAIDQTEDVIIHDEGVHRLRYAYTREVASCVADGVAGVWYPEMMGSSMATMPVYASGAEWQSLLSAAPGSGIDTKHVGIGNSVAVPDANQPEFGDRIPIIAARQVGQGRLAVCGIPSGYHIDAPHNFPEAKRFLIDGFDGKPSGLQRLLVNTMGWLSEPSLASGTLGAGASGPFVLEPNVPRYPDDPPVLWAARTFPPDDPKPVKGLIGARTAASIGRGTVAEYVENAQAAGLDFIVFLEDYKALSPDKWEAVKAECAALTTDSFFAVPGYTIEDAVGAHTFQYGYTMPLPPPEILSADGKILSNESSDGTVRTSTYESVHFTMTFETLNLRGRRGRYLHDQAPNFFLDHRTFDSIALVTWHDGKILEDVRDRFHLLEDKAFRIIPTTLALMDGPEDVVRALDAGWVTMMIEPYETIPNKVLRKYMAPELEWWGMIDEERANTRRFRFDNWQYGTPFQYITNGPVVEAWTASVTSRDPVWRAPDTEIPPTADWFRVDVTQYRLRIKVSSAVGLAEVRLFDGTRVIRCWQCNGAALFEQELDLMHHQQMHLTLEADDVNGGAAVCGTYCTLRLDWCEFYCADRNNPLCIGFQKDDRGLAYGWSGTLYLTYNNFQWGGTSCYLGRWWYGGDNIYPVPKNPVDDEIFPSDGGVRDAGAGMHIYIKMPKLPVPELWLVIAPNQELISTDVSVDSFVVNKGFDPAWPFFHGKERTGFGLFPVHDTRYLDYRHTKTVFRPRPYALTTWVYESELRFKQAPGITDPLPFGWFDDAARITLFRNDGTRVELAGFDESPFSTMWRRGEYLTAWLTGSRPSLFINDGPDLLLVRELDPATKELGPTNLQYGHLAFRMPVETLPNVGEVTRVRFLAVGGSSETTDPNFGEAMRAAMGLVGNPAYAIEMEVGTVRDQRLLLTLDGQGTGVACRMPRTELPMALPIIIENLNPNWPVFFVDRARNRWRPLGMYQSSAYATLDTLAGDWSIFMGHPLTATDAKVVLNLAQIGARAWVLEMHNPTERDLTVTITPTPYCTLLEWAGETLTIPAGSSITRNLTGTTLGVEAFA